jgi:hypothetical protein
VSLVTVTINLPPGVEKAFLAEARAKGVSLDELVLSYLLTPQTASPAADLTPEDWVREFKTWTRSHAKDSLPLLSDVAIRRDFIYRERGL